MIIPQFAVVRIEAKHLDIPALLMGVMQATLNEHGNVSLSVNDEQPDLISVEAHNDLGHPTYVASFTNVFRFPPGPVVPEQLAELGIGVLNQPPGSRLEN